MARRGRKPVEIDFGKLEKLCGLQCTLEEIAGFFSVSADTIERRCKSHYGINFADVYKRFSASGKISLRRYQFRQARTNAGMAIWLGKQHLGQKEQIVAEVKSQSGPADPEKQTAAEAALKAARKAARQVARGTRTRPGQGDPPGDS
jgi:AraC-like DNA-binding protein